MIEFAPMEIMLMQYAAGTLTPYEALMVAAHLSLKPEARKKVSTYEKSCGEMIKEVPPAHLQSGCLEKVLSRIDACKEAAGPCHEKKTELPQDIGIPKPVYDLLKDACTAEARQWKQMTGGVMKIELRVCATEPARRKLRLVRMAPRQTTPAHAHAGREITLVLEGGFTDVTGHYGRGDILIVNDPRFVHSPCADETGCLMLSLTEAPLRFRHPMAGILNLFFRS